MKRIFSVLCAATFVLGACSSSRQSTEDTDEAQEVASTGEMRTVRSRDGRFDGFIRGTPAPDSLFLKLEIGMSQAEVESLIGRGSDRRAYITGKQFIPFYFGSDKYRYEIFYKGMGAVVYSTRWGRHGKLVGINHDANETGYGPNRK